MKRYFIAATLIATAVLFSCKKNDSGTGKEHTWSGLPENGAVFSAYNYSEGVRSHFYDPTSGTLLWDDDDDIAVYSIDFDAAEPFSGIKSGVAYIDGYYAGQSGAKFKSLLSKEEWFDSDDPAATRKFFSYYPCNGIAQTIETDYPLGEAGIIFDISDTQAIGEEDSFSKLQLLVSDSKSVNFSDETINLGTFRPITALLRFNIQSEIDVEFKVNEIELRLGSDPYYSNGAFYSFNREIPIAGTFLLEMDRANGGFTGISNHYEDYTHCIDLIPSEPFTPGDTPEKYYYAVVCPTLDVPQGEDLYLAVLAFAEGTNTRDSSGNGSSIYKVGMLQLPNGFESGYRYDFTVNFDQTGTMKIGNLSTINLGEYEIIDWE